MTKYNFSLIDEVEEEPLRDSEDYIAVKGINHKGLGLRVNPGELVPEALKTIRAFDMWVKDGVIKKAGG